jgi:uncharacterized protein (TIGR02246 family)
MAERFRQKGETKAMTTIIDIEQWFKCAVAAAALAISMGASVLPASAADKPSLQARVRKLEDEAQIRHLLVEYGDALDTRDFTRYSQLFTKEGTWTGSLGTAKGPAAILALMLKSFKDSPYDPKNVKTFHLDTNFLIRIDGDRATVLSKWTVFGRTQDNKLEPHLAGHYDDTIVRENGQWKFLSRVAVNDIPPLNY